MDTAHWHQEMGVVKPMEDLLSTTTTSGGARAAPPQLMERRARPQKEQALNCPRCNSTNTKFCYYNNYSLTQPRYFCKTCRRYWTEGGSLRNVPVGGGSRKNKRSSSSSSSLAPAATAAAATAAVSSTVVSSQNPKFHEGQDLNLAYPHHGMAEFGGSNNPSAMEFLRSGISGRAVGPFMQMSMPMAAEETPPVYPSGFGLHDFRPATGLSFPLDGIGGAGGGGGGGGSGYGSLHEGAGRLLFPFEDLKQVPSSSDQFEQNRGQGGEPTGFWNGMIGGGSW